MAYTLTPICSKRFSDYDADVVFQSSDSVQFRIHRKYLDATAGGFPPADFADPGPGEIIQLQEDSQTLELLFQFTCPNRHPILDDVAFEILAAVAEAAEKYEVYAGMNHCLHCMKAHVQDHADQVIVYAAKHDYPSLLDAAAPQALSRSLPVIVSSLPQRLVVPWIKYHEQYISIRNNALNYNSFNRSHSTLNNASLICRHWEERYRGPITAKLLADVSVFFDLKRLFEADYETRKNMNFGCCVQQLTGWKKQTAEDLAGVKPLRDFL